MTEEEYKKFITPDDFERKAALVKKGIENSKMKLDRLNRFKRFNQWGKRASEYNEK